MKPSIYHFGALTIVLLCLSAIASDPDPTIICKKKSSCIKKITTCKVSPEIHWRDDRYAEVETLYSYLLDTTYNCMSSSGSVAELIDQEKLGPFWFHPTGQYDYDKYEYVPESKEKALAKAKTELLERCEFTRNTSLELYDYCDE